MEGISAKRKREMMKETTNCIGYRYDVLLENNINTCVVLNIKALCQHKNITLNSVEKHIGVQVGYFSRKYRSESIIGLKEIYEVSKLFNVPINDLIEKEYWKIFELEILNKKMSEIQQRINEIEKGD